MICTNRVRITKKHVLRIPTKLVSYSSNLLLHYNLHIEANFWENVFNWSFHLKNWLLHHDLHIYGQVSIQILGATFKEPRWMVIIWSDRISIHRRYPVFAFLSVCLSPLQNINFNSYRPSKSQFSCAAKFSNWQFCAGEWT